MEFERADALCKLECDGGDDELAVSDLGLAVAIEKKTGSKDAFLLAALSQRFGDCGFPSTRHAVQPEDMRRRGIGIFHPVVNLPQNSGSRACQTQGPGIFGSVMTCGPRPRQRVYSVKVVWSK